MFKINIVAVGKVKEKYFADGIDEYIKRLSKYAEVSLTEIKEENFTSLPSESERKRIIQKEGDEILKKLRGKVCATCIEGEKISSEALAKFIKESVDKGEELTFVIGGSYGLDSRIKAQASKKLSFSPMTFPHTMFRLMLTEQIYRAFTIINGSPYHK